MTAPVSTRRVDDVLVVTISNPPVNALGHAVRQALSDVLDAAEADDAVRAIVLTASGDLFVGGSDINEFKAPRLPPVLPDLCDRIEASHKPVVAALNGAALGGGFELALAAHARVAAPRAELALPEVLLGLMPGAGGTQRATALAGPAVALPMMLTGQRMSARDALANGLVDVVDDAPLDHAIRMASALATDRAHLRRTRALTPPGTPEAHGEIVAAARAALATTARGLFSPARIIDAVELACSQPGGATREQEAALFRACQTSPQSEALIHLFFAERAVGKADSAVTPRPVAQVGVVGGGTMGTGIAQALLNAGVTVTLVEQNAARAAGARDSIVASYEASQQKGRIAATDVADRVNRLTCSDQRDALATADLVIEAVFEDLAVKQALFADLSARCRPGAVLATNTSYLDVNAIAAATTRPHDVIGLHFFSPAHIMKLVEVVAPAGAASDAVATGFALARRMRKIAVRSGVCDGFIGNRMLAVYRRAAEYALADGASPYEIDDAIRAFGFAMGPFQVMDLAGGDISWAVRTQRAPLRDPCERYVPIADQLCERGWFGQKTGRGWYRYVAGSRAGTPDPEVLALIDAERTRTGVTVRRFTADEIVERYLAAMINEGARVVGDGIAQRPLDVDIVLVHGYGFPRHVGGPMHYADRDGPAAWLATVQRLAEDDPFFWQPAPLLVSLAAEGRSFSSLNP
jgi:3-hydroxyacyl-CoA dehydrogenase